MKKLIQNFQFKILILTLILALLVYILKNTMLPQIQNWVYVSLIYYFLLNVIIYKITHKINVSPRKSVNSVLIATMLRLFCTLTFLIIILLINDIKDISSIILFLFFYFCYLVFEIYHLIYKLRPQI